MEGGVYTMATPDSPIVNATSSMISAYSPRAAAASSISLTAACANAKVVSGGRNASAVSHSSGGPVSNASFKVLRNSV